MLLTLLTFTFDGKDSIYTVVESLLSGTNLCGQKATICLLCSLVYLGPLHQNHSSVSTLLWTTVARFFYKIDRLTLLRYESESENNHLFGILYRQKSGVICNIP